MIWRSVWRDTWDVLRRPWVWHSFLQTLVGVLGLWIVVTGITQMAHSGPSVPGVVTAHLAEATWGLLSFGLVGALACLPWLAGRFYDRLSATMHHQATTGTPQRYQRGFQWIVGFSGYWAGWALIGVGLIRPMSLVGAEVVTVLGIWLTLPWLLRWFGATFWDRLTGWAAIRQTLRGDSYGTLWLGISATIWAVLLLGGVSVGLVQAFGHPTWVERIGLFVSGDVVLDLAMTCWYLALYAKTAAFLGPSRKWQSERDAQASSIGPGTP